MNSEAKPNKALVEARAKIIWGEAPEEAISLLAANGFGSEQAKMHVESFIRERASEIRKQGMIDLLKGTCIALAGITPIAVMCSIGLIYEKVFGLCIGIAAYGAWLLFKGIERLALGSKAEASITNLE